ncbi:MAG: hypothetical protein M1828_006039 [Chrysothrix sp. TS-e1954]|nr:MAG: hypothetical protein M1828_006039 [Chrysothrix sp. TS-e1954]
MGSTASKTDTTSCGRSSTSQSPPHGHKQKRSSTSASSAPTSVPDSPTSPIPEVSNPAPRNEITHLSALIDPVELARSGSMARSPSGNLLSSVGLLDRRDRPLCVRERQESIRAALGSAVDLVSYEKAATIKGDPQTQPPAKRKKGHIWCCV